MIDTKEPIRFFDDTCKNRGYVYVVDILYEDDNLCLCRTGCSNHILFDKLTHEVLTTNFQFWYAENFYKV